MTGPRKKRLGEVLRERKRVSFEALEAALDDQQKGAGLLGELLIQREACSKDDIVSALEEITHFRYVDARFATVERELIKLLPQSAAERYCVLPLVREGKRIVAVMAEPQNLHQLDELRFMTGMDIIPRLGFKGEIAEAIKKCYGEDAAETAAATPPLPFIDQEIGRAHV